tara:strand:- start:46 stop:555 length:510 start_codon:yes stop_codon:yes gene_type:complete
MASLANSETNKYVFDFSTECWEFYQGIKNLKKDDVKIKTKLIEYLKTGIKRKPMPDKTHWENVKELLMMIRRNPDHFKKFAKKHMCLDIERKTNSLRDGWYLKMKNVSIDMLKDMIKEYCYKYVRCDEKGCMSYNTKLKLDPKLKSWVMTCRSCQRQKVVEDIKFSKIC